METNLNRFNSGAGFQPVGRISNPSHGRHGRETRHGRLDACPTRRHADFHVAQISNLLYLQPDPTIPI